MKTPIPVYRITITEPELFAAMEILSEVKNSLGLSKEGQSLYDKLDEYAYKANKGTKKPAYLATGRTSSVPSLHSLGATEDELHRSLHSPETIEEAEMLAANEYVITGVRKPWYEFVDSPIASTSSHFQDVSKISGPGDSDSYDSELFKLL